MPSPLTQSIGHASASLAQALTPSQAGRESAPPVNTAQVQKAIQAASATTAVKVKEDKKRAVQVPKKVEANFATYSPKKKPARHPTEEEREEENPLDQEVSVEA